MRKHRSFFIFNYYFVQETVVVNILLSGAPNLGSLAISDISYNTSAFELLSVDWKVADAILSNWDAATGKGALTLSTSKDINGTIISLTFKAKDGTADGNYPVSCTVTSQECDFKNVAGQINFALELKRFCGKRHCF